VRLPHLFQRHRSEGLAATYHFTFTGGERVTATVVIRDKSIRVEDGLVGRPDLHVTADSEAWIGFLRKERSLVWALLRRKIRLRGPALLLRAFGRCFPS
jgi:putative sterol carrier protein